MKAIILSAGMGTRVGNHTAVTPKCMLDILGTNILEIQVKQYCASRELHGYNPALSLANRLEMIDLNEIFRMRPITLKFDRREA